MSQTVWQPMGFLVLLLDPGLGLLVLLWPHVLGGQIYPQHLPPWPILLLPSSLNFGLSNSCVTGSST